MHNLIKEHLEASFIENKGQTTQFYTGEGKKTTKKHEYN